MCRLLLFLMIEPLTEPLTEPSVSVKSGMWRFARFPSTIECCASTKMYSLL